MTAELTILTNFDFDTPYLEAIQAAAAPAQVHKATDTETFLQRLPTADILHGFHFPPGTGNAPRLRWVQLHSAGVDQLQGSGLLESTIPITTVSGIHAIPIGEYVLSLLLLFARRWPQILAIQQTGHWATRDERQELRGSELYGHTLAIVGLGNIGRHVAQLGHAFGMQVLATSRTAKPGTSDPDVDCFFSPAALTDLLGQADYVVLSMPLTGATTKLIGEQELHAMRPTAYLINIARGGVLDQEALLRALDAGWLAGAGLDVAEGEPLADNHPLLTHPKVILSPHISGNTPRYNERAVAVFCDNLRRFRKGEPLRNVFDRARGY